MSIIKPYTFVAGNKARANEVNEDFDVLYQQVNTNITNIANAESEIENLDSTKADINGSSSQRFAVANPVSSGDAVNKRTLFKQIGNSIDYIGGLAISKDSGSPNDTILVSTGAAYDSEKEIVLALDVLTSKQNTTQSANATYYVYIIGNATGSSTDILISTNSSVPPLPSGYTLYRKIGSYKTNSSSNISSITNISNTALLNEKISATTSKGANGYCKLSNGIIIQWGKVTSMGNNTDKQVTLPTAFSNSNYCVAGSTDYRQYSGDKASSWRAYDYNTSYFKIQSEFEQSSDNTIRWIAIGY